jgi:hypothetical protein
LTCRWWWRYVVDELRCCWSGYTAGDLDYEQARAKTILATSSRTKSIPMHVCNGNISNWTQGSRFRSSTRVCVPVLLCCTIGYVSITLEIAAAFRTDVGQHSVAKSYVYDMRLSM